MDSISCPQGVGPTNWKTVIPRKFSHWRAGSEPLVQQWEEKSLESPALKASGIWLVDHHRTGGNRNSTLEGHMQILECSRTYAKKAVIPQETGPDLSASTGGSPAEVVEQATAGTKTLAAVVLGSAHWHEPSWRPPLPKSNCLPNCFSFTTNAEGPALQQMLKNSSRQGRDQQLKTTLSHIDCYIKTLWE